MPFRKRKCFIDTSLFLPCVLHAVPQDDGSVIMKPVDVLDSLPPCEEFALKALLDSGVDLKKVSTIVFRNGVSEFNKILDSMDVQSEETKPVETKPVEIKPVEIKPVETKPVEE